MNREILFRGRSIDTGKWVYGGIHFPFLDIAQIIHTQGINMSHISQVDPETIGQFTGLTDKNGTKIFEGDIITYNFLTKSSNEQFISPVSFEEYMWITEEHSLNRLNNIELTGGNIHDKI